MTPHNLQATEHERGEMRYEAEGFAQEEYSADSINANCVCSWRRTKTADGLSIELDFHNGWVFHSDGWSDCPGVVQRVAQRLHDLEIPPTRILRI